MARLQTTGRPSFRPKKNNGQYNKFKHKHPSKELYGENWEATSDYVRRRDDYTCQVNKLNLGWRCSVVLRPPFHWLLHVHHIVPLPRGSNHPKNLLTVCRDCHGKIHGKNLGTVTDKQKRAGKRITR